MRKSDPRRAARVAGLIGVLSLSILTIALVVPRFMTTRKDAPPPPPVVAHVPPPSPSASASGSAAVSYSSSQK